MVVHKGADGVLQRLQHSGLTAGEADRGGAVVGALIGLDATSEEADGGPPEAEQELWSLDEAIPNDSAGGVPVADAWVHPADLAAAGLSDA